MAGIKTKKKKDADFGNEAAADVALVLRSLWPQTEVRRPAPDGSKWSDFLFTGPLTPESKGISRLPSKLEGDFDQAVGYDFIRRDFSVPCVIYTERRAHKKEKLEQRIWMDLQDFVDLIVRERSLAIEKALDRNKS